MSFIASCTNISSILHENDIKKITKYIEPVITPNVFIDIGLKALKCDLVLCNKKYFFMLHLGHQTHNSDVLMCR